MWKTLQKINKNLIVAIPVLMVAGFLTGMFVDASPLKQLIVPFTFLMVYPMMVTLKIQSIPTVILYKDGKEVKRFVGLQSAETLGNAL